jgi:mRNA-degrading endonuclease toxin of MazEF toxin-antitoxin module
VTLEPEDGVPSRCAVSLDNIATIEQDLFMQFIATLPAERMNQVWEALHEAFEMPF